MLMTKQAVITFQKQNHEIFKKVIKGLSDDQMISVKIIDDWSVKDIIAHLSAWNWQVAAEIDTVLAGKNIWYIGNRVDTFNRKEVAKRHPWPLEKLLKEWEASFDALTAKLAKLTREEWNFKTEFFWDDGTVLTVGSFFDYRYEGAGHEGGHAKQIEEALRLQE